MDEISVVIPTRNRRQALSRVLRSVVGMTGVTLQPIVVVEGSNDGTFEALKRMRVPDLIVVQHETPRGVSYARNVGLARADSRYVGFVDDDDLWAPTRAFDAIEAMRSVGAPWSRCGAAYLDGRGVVTGLHAPGLDRDLGLSVYRGNPVPGGGSGMIAERDFLLDGGGFSPRFTDLADWEFWVRLARSAPIASVNRYQIAYTLDDRAASYTTPARCYEELSRMRRLHGFGVAGHPDYDPAAWSRWMSGQHWRARDRRGLARLWVAEALRNGRPLDFARSVAYLSLPRSWQNALRRRFLRREVRSQDAAHISEAERWIAGLGEERAVSGV
jgi:glycosyltransferase involved in cell wall biosynthesis